MYCSQCICGAVWIVAVLMCGNMDCSSTDCGSTDCGSTVYMCIIASFGKPPPLLFWYIFFRNFYCRFWLLWAMIRILNTTFFPIEKCISCFTVLCKTGQTPMQNRPDSTQKFDVWMNECKVNIFLENSGSDLFCLSAYIPLLIFFWICAIWSLESSFSESLYPTKGFEVVSLLARISLRFFP